MRRLVPLLASLLAVAAGVCTAQATTRSPVNPSDCWTWQNESPNFTVLSGCVAVSGTVVWTSGTTVDSSSGFDIWIVPDTASAALLNCSGQPGCLPATQLELVVPQWCNVPGQTVACLPIGAVGTPSLPMPANLGDHLPAPGTQIAAVGVWVYNQAHDRTALNPVESLCFWTPITAPTCGSTILHQVISNTEKSTSKIEATPPVTFPTAQSNQYAVLGVRLTITLWSAQPMRALAVAEVTVLTAEKVDPVTAAALTGAVPVPQ